MSKTVLIAINASAGKLLELADGSMGLQLQVEDAEAARLEAAGVVDFTEGDDFAKGCPAKWKTKSGDPRHEVFGHPLKRAAAVDVEVVAEPEPKVIVIE